MLKTKCLLILSIIAFTIRSPCQHTTLHEPGVKYVDQFAVLFDSEDNINATNVLGHKNKFRTYERRLLGNSDSKDTYWLWIKLTNRTQKPSYIDFDNKRLWKIDVYVKNNNQLHLINKLGALDRSKRESQNQIGDLVEGPGPNETNEYFVFVSNFSDLTLPVWFGTHSEIIQHKRPLQNFVKRFEGWVVGITILNLLFLITTRDINYLFYILHILTFCVFVMYIGGDLILTKFFSTEVSNWLITHPFTWLNLPVLLTGVFIMNFLELKARSKPIFRLLLTMTLMIGVGVPTLNGFDIFMLKHLLKIERFLITLYVLIIGFIFFYLMIYKKVRDSKFLSVGWLVMIGHLTLFALGSMGLIPYTNYSHEYSLYVGLGSETLLSSLALGNRIFSGRKEGLLGSHESIKAAIQDQVDKQTQLLSEENRRNETVLSIISHNIKGPFNSLYTLLSLEEELDMHLGQKDFKAHKSEMKKRLKVIISRINDLQAWSSSQKKGFNPNFKDVSLSKSIDRLQLLFKDEMDYKNVTLDIQIQPNLNISTDPEIFFIILENITHNAIKFSEPDHSIQIRSEVTDHHLTLIIADNGPGISEEAILLMQTSKIQKSTLGTMGEPGTGLGLSIANSLMNMVGIKYSIRSDQDGTTFSLQIPIGR